MKYENVPAPALKIPNLESGNCISGSLYGFSGGEAGSEVNTMKMYLPPFENSKSRAR